MTLKNNNLMTNGVMFTNLSSLLKNVDDFLSYFNLIMLDQIEAAS